MDKITQNVVSLIIPFYNVEKYFNDCLHSITNQTYKNLDIILVNDGATDKSIEIARDFAKDDERILIINKINGGQSSARNMGLEFIKDSLLRKALDERLRHFKTHKKCNENTMRNLQAQGVMSKNDKILESNKDLKALDSKTTDQNLKNTKIINEDDLSHTHRERERERLGEIDDIKNISHEKNNKCQDIESIINFILQNTKIISHNEIEINQQSLYDWLELRNEYGYVDIKSSAIQKNLKNINHYIMFVDSDDFLEVGCVNVALKKALELDVDILHFDLTYFYDDITPKNVFIKNKFKELENIVFSPRKYLKKFFNSHFAFVVCGLLHVRVLTNLRFIEKIQYEDHNFGIRLFYFSHTLSFLDERLYIYRIRPNSTCAYSNSAKMPTFLNTLVANLKSEQKSRFYNDCFAQIINAHNLYFDENFKEPHKTKNIIAYLAYGVQITIFKNDVMNAKKYINDLLPFIKTMGFRANMALKFPRLFRILIFIKHAKITPKFLRFPWNRNDEFLDKEIKKILLFDS